MGGRHLEYERLGVSPQSGRCALVEESLRLLEVFLPQQLVTQVEQVVIPLLVQMRSEGRASVAQQSRFDQLLARGVGVECLHDNFGHMAKVGVRHLGRDRTNAFFLVSR